MSDEIVPFVDEPPVYETDTPILYASKDGIAFITLNRPSVHNVQNSQMTYALDDGKQYIVMVAGGHGSVGTDPGDYVIAYTLPD